MKKWTKRRRVFLNYPSSGCAATCVWNVGVERSIAWGRLSDDECDAGITTKGRKLPREWSLSAELNISEDAQSHYIHRKADMRALYRMQKELDAFITATEQAFKDVEEGNAES
jgi:hypothetical protein